MFFICKFLQELQEEFVVDERVQPIVSNSASAGQEQDLVATSNSITNCNTSSLTLPGLSFLNNAVIHGAVTINFKK